MQITLEVPDNFPSLPAAHKQMLLLKAIQSNHEMEQSDQNWKEQWQVALDKAYGLWEDRDDLDARELRSSWDRNLWKR